MTQQESFQVGSRRTGRLYFSRLECRASVHDVVRAPRLLSTPIEQAADVGPEADAARQEARATSRASPFGEKCWLTVHR